MLAAFWPRSGRVLAVHGLAPRAEPRRAVHASKSRGQGTRARGGGGASPRILEDELAAGDGLARLTELALDNRHVPSKKPCHA